MTPHACGGRGFTLVELLVVLALAALMMTVIPPLFSAAVPGVELQGAARRTYSALRLARETAVRSGGESVLVVDVEGHRLEIPGYRAISLPQRIDLKLEAASSEMLDEQRGGIRFFPDGSSTGGRIILARGEGRDQRGYQVGVTWLTGRVRMAPWEAE
ncbi:MAG: GspH/FimT family protein [Bdellovibrio bacteriovorus]